VLGLVGDVTQLISAATLASLPNGDPRWYAHVDGKSYGPYGRSDVERMIRNRQIRAGDYLCPEGGAEWIEARNDPTFGHLLSERVDVAALLPDFPVKKPVNAARAAATGESTPAIKNVAVKEPPLGLAQFKVPWLTLSILAVLIVIFMLENASAVSPGSRGLTPSVATLIAFGASSHALVFSNGEWYRLFTAPLLHANFPHILGNGLALVLGGWILERLVGRLWFFTFFTVGASGALMGMFAGLFIAAFRFPFGTASRTRLVLYSLRVLVPSLLPFFPTSAVGRIDYGAHIGGMLSGGILALLLLMCWPEGARIPQLRPVAAFISALGAVLFVASGGLAIADRSEFIRSLLPRDVLEDHGVERAACDFKWSALNSRDAGAYRAFLQKCMYEDSTKP
jgi:membrane associated rhomboid family serine protease